MNPATASRMLPALMIESAAILPPFGSASIMALACASPIVVQFVPM